MSKHSVPCTCFETRVVDGHRVRGHGKMTLRGAVDSVGRVRYKCTNPRCGRTTHMQGHGAFKAPSRIGEVVYNPNVDRRHQNADRVDIARDYLV